MNFRIITLSLLPVLALTSCSTKSQLTEVAFIKAPQEGFDDHHYVVKTTAYTHHEADSQPYGNKNAIGTTLKYTGDLRSAAADWSRYPVGTKFKIVGDSQIYQVDDYGSALVGTDTIDIYQPTLTAMRRWGAPMVGIQVLEWGSFRESATILRARIDKAQHCREMYEGIKEKVEELPEELHDGFPVSEEAAEYLAKRRIS